MHTSSSGASKVQVGFGGTGAKTYKATVVGLDKTTDIAVLKVDLPASALRPLTLGDSNDVHVGDPVVAIGNPLGETQTVTSGIVSAVQRQISSLAKNQDIYGAIQTDAAINHGNSGGPLLDAHGQVIGITSQILSSGSDGGSIGIGFAIPIDTAKQVADQIITTGHAQHTYLGIEGVPLTSGLAKALNIPSSHGVLVAQVTHRVAGVEGGDPRRQHDRNHLRPDLRAGRRRDRVAQRPLDHHLQQPGRTDPGNVAGHNGHARRAPGRQAAKRQGRAGLTRVVARGAGARQVPVTSTITSSTPARRSRTASSTRLASRWAARTVSDRSACTDVTTSNRSPCR